MLTAHEKYCLKFPTIRARTVSSSLFSAIREAKIDMCSFLSGIGFSSFHNVAIDKLPSRLGRYMVSKFSPTTYRVTFETGQYVQVTSSKIHDMLGIPVGGISLFSLDVRPMTHDFVNFQLSYLVGLKGQICLDVVRRLREDCDISKIDWCNYIYSFLEDSELPDKPTVQYLGPFTLLILLYLDSTKFDRFPVVRTRPTIRDWTSTLMRQRQDLETKHRVIGCLDLHDEWTESECQEAEAESHVILFESHGIQLESHGILFESHEIQVESHEIHFKSIAEEKLAAICSERVFLEDLMRKASSDYPGDGKFVELQAKYVQVFRDPISFDVDMDVVNESNGDDDNDNDGDGNGDEEDPNGSNPRFGFSKISLNDFGNDSGPTEKESVDPAEQGIGDFCFESDVIQSESDEIQSESHVIHFESHVILSESHNVFETHSGEYSVYGLRLNMETLAPGLWIDANVIDCWGAILNHEERFRVADSKTRHFFPTGCITQSMFDGTLATDDAKWDSFSNQVKAQFSGNDDRLALQGIDLKKLFTRHLKEYGHDRHTKIAKLIPKIPKLKWRTKGNYQDCGIFTMLHMESYNAGAVANWDCGLVAESGLQLDMLRRLRFKFSTKILLHEINVHAQKMLDLAKEFDKLESDEKVSIIIHALKNRKERDRI
ncbi:ulp1 protease family, C-terminal catalytic domain-containing protein [Tanacetum coccineum]